MSSQHATLTDASGKQYELRSETFSEKVVIDSYTAAATGALAAADAVADKIATAGFSIATAYAAVIALVAPKDSKSTMFVVSPFVLLGAAVVLALVAQSIKMSLDPTNDTTVVANRVTSAISTKRGWLYVALVALVAGLIVGGIAVYETYGPGAENTPSTKVSIWLTPSGKHLMMEACGKSSNPLVGEVTGTDALSTSTVAVTVAQSQCPKGAGTLVLSKRAIATSKY